MRALAAPDKFRGTLSAREAAAALARGARAAGWSCAELPLADGGEGTLEALGGANRTTVVTGPLGAPVPAGWRLDGRTAVVEMALASGLELAGGAARNDPLQATTEGTGELLAAALDAGATTLVVCVGGSATTDGGAGALAALGARAPFPEGVDVCVACDVSTPFVDAARVFGPQKGAAGAELAELTGRLERLVATYRERFGVDVSALPGAGAAGGLAGGLAAAGARLVPGFELVAELVGLESALEGVELVLTGEGRLDATSFAGKVVGGVLRHAAARGARLVIVAGRIDPDAAGPGRISLVERFGASRAVAETAACVEDAARLALA